jgi:hypothetical protein
MADIKHIADLDLTDKQKAMLAYLTEAKTTYEVAAKFKKSFSGTSQALKILEALKYVTKITKMKGNGVLYQRKAHIQA